MAEPNEDIIGDVEPFAIEDEPDRTPDPDQNKKSVLRKIQKYLKTQIAKHNSFDVIEPAAEGVMTTQQQVQLNKQLVIHLRNIKEEIDTKLKELS